MKTYSHYMIVDVEATCCNQETFPRSEMEIIEIGAAMVDGDTFELIDDYSIFIRPVRNPILTDFCVDLTTIDQTDVNEAPMYYDAIPQFQEWFSSYRDVAFCSWGDYDRKQFDRDAKYHGEATPIEMDHINIKKLFAKQQGIKRPCGVGKALNMAGLSFIGTQHRGIDDARNMMRLMPHIFGDKKI